MRARPQTVDELRNELASWNFAIHGFIVLTSERAAEMAADFLSTDVCQEEVKFGILLLINIGNLLHVYYTRQQDRIKIEEAKLRALRNFSAFASSAPREQSQGTVRNQLSSISEDEEESSELSNSL